MKNLTKTELYQRLARLESMYDQLESEVVLLDGALRSVGFEEGIRSIMTAAEELIALDLYPT